MNLIVGKNNAGKSNVVSALNLLFGDRYPTYLNFEDKDFYKYKDNSVEVDDGYFWVLAKLEGDISPQIYDINGIWMGKLNCFPFLVQDTKVDIHEALKIDIAQELDGCEDFESWGYRGSKKVYAKPDGNFNASLIEHLKNKKSAWILLYVTKDESGEICQKDFSFILETPEAFYRCWGLSSEFRDSLINSAVIPSFRDPEKQLKINNWSWYGKLIKRIWDENKDQTVPIGGDAQEAMSYSQTMNTLFTRINEIGNRLFEDIMQDIKQNMDMSFQDCDFSLQFVTDTKDDIYKTINIFVDDGYKSLLSNKGSGIQSAFIISAFCYYCSTFHKNSSLLVVEEPELYLHPQGRRSILQVFEDFINLVDTENQAIITTHSSDFIKPEYINNITVVRKEDGNTNQYKVNISDEADFKKKQIFNWKQNNELFFSEKILIVEGAEERIIPLIADKIKDTNSYLDKNNISVIRANGKGNISKYIEIAEMLNIEWFALADLDFLFKGLESLEDIVEYDKTQLSTIRSSVSKLLEAEENKWKKSNKLESRLLKPEESLDAKAFCSLMEKMEIGENVEDELLKLWRYLKPNLKNKANSTLLNDNQDDYKIIKEFICELKKKNIFILEKGELEDYLTEDAIKLSKSKEIRIFEIVSKVEEGENLNTYLEESEFEEFVATALI
jgi:energy-coupling factor transporter ATP-binding protein EcfA2